MTLGENMLLTGLFWEQYFRWDFSYSETLFSFSSMFSHLLSFLSLLRSWCDYSALARRHCYLLSAIKQRLVQFHRLSPVSFSISAVWYFQFVWLFLCSDSFPLYLQTPLEYLTQALKEDLEKVPILYYRLTCFPLCHVAVLINHCFFFFYQIWDSVQKPEAYKEAALSDFFNVGASVFWK